MSEPGTEQATNQPLSADPTREPVTPPSTPEPSVEDAQARYLGFLVFVGILYFAVVFRTLPEGSIRWAITGGLVVAALAAWVAARRWKSLAKMLPGAYDSLIFTSFVLAIVLAAIYLATEDKVVLLKILAVVYFSLLPALLYLQFSSGRTLAVWRDYVSNLYKLRIDDPANLPRPPSLSPFHRDWHRARERAWEERRVTLERPDETREDVYKRLEDANQYRLKFRDLFGEIPLLEHRLTVLSLRSAHKLQVVLATVLVTLGWTFVVQPETVFDRSFAPADFQLANLPEIPSETFAFAFLGAYFYVLQMLVRRYFQNDLKATAYINATMRIVIVVLLVWVIDPLLADVADQATRSAVAFVVGVFPSVGWQILQQAVRKVVGTAVASLEPEHKLGDLDGLNIWYESRLLEVGVEDMQNLATTDIVDLMLNTRIPVDRIVDWIDQAFLYLRVLDEGERALLRRYGIRTATDLDDALSDQDVAASLEQLLNVVWSTPFTVPTYKDDGTPGYDGLPSRIRALHATIETERNLQHVRAWKRYTVDETAFGTEPQRKPEVPSAAVPQPA